MALDIKRVLKSKGISVNEFADILNINRVSLSSQINGNPTLETLQKWADILSVDISELFSPKSSTDFLAMINYKGEMKQFTSVGELKKFLAETEK